MYTLTIRTFAFGPLYLLQNDYQLENDPFTGALSPQLHSTLKHGLGRGYSHRPDFDLLLSSPNPSNSFRNHIQLLFALKQLGAQVLTNFPYQHFATLDSLSSMCSAVEAKYGNSESVRRSSAPAGSSGYTRTDNAPSIGGPGKSIRPTDPRTTAHNPARCGRSDTQPDVFVSVITKSIDSRIVWTHGYTFRELQFSFQARYLRTAVESWGEDPGKKHGTGVEYWLSTGCRTEEAAYMQRLTS